MPRKTFSIEEFVESANRQLLRSVDTTIAEGKAMRTGVCMMVEKVLMDSGRYGGFSYLSEADLEMTKKQALDSDHDVVLPGFIEGVDDVAERFDPHNTDPTRRRYMVKGV